MFRLLKYFSIASFASVVVATIVLSALFQRSSTQGLLELGERNNVLLTQSFANSLWPKLRPLLESPQTPSSASPHARASIDDLHSQVLMQMSGTNVVKVKVYNLQGRTVYSTEPSQIGGDESTNSAFQEASKGKVASALTYKDRFTAFHHEISQRDILFSYIPLRSNVNGTVEGVFEVYTDVTDLTEKLKEQRQIVTLSVATVFAVLYIVLFLIVKRADTIIADSARKLQHVATHDELTGLPNRSFIQGRIKQTIQIAAGQARKIALLFIDLDNFKIVNDTHGHEVGDTLLTMAAARLANCVRSGDIVSRQGGDEFMVLLPSIDDPLEAGAVAQKILGSLTQPFLFQNMELRIGASIGISIFPSDGTDEVTLLKHSDIAMYQAKSAGKSNYRFFSAPCRADPKSSPARVAAAGASGPAYR
jgi:diguanylate cyclase (GGDEF)-like protein